MDRRDPHPETKMDSATEHENSYGYARYIKLYDIKTDGIMYRLDVIDSTGEHKGIDFRKGGLEPAKHVLKNSIVGTFKPVPTNEFEGHVEFIKL